MKDAGKYGFEHSTAAWASYMGHSTTNSGAFRQRLAALRDWKLITGRGDSLTMTEVGRMIALPTEEDAERQALRATFHSYPAFSRLYEDSAKGTPLAAKGLGNRAVHEFGVAPQQAQKFVDSFIESAVIAGLAEVSEDGKAATLIVFDEDSADGIGAAGSLGTSQTAMGKVHGSSSVRTGAPVIHQSWMIPGGAIIFEIRSDRPLPASTFVTVGEVVASLENLAYTLAPRKSEGGEVSSEAAE